MRLEHHLVGGYVRYISPHIIIIIIISQSFLGNFWILAGNTTNYACSYSVQLILRKYKTT